jgi:hypothetical protein
MSGRRRRRQTSARRYSSYRSFLKLLVPQHAMFAAPTELGG